MNSKTIKRIRTFVGLVLFLTYLIFKYLDLEFNFDLVLWVFGFSFLILSIFHITNLKRIKPEFPNSFFPYRPTFIGVNQWFTAVAWIVIGVGKMVTGDTLFGTVLVVLWLTIVIEKIAENRKNIFNVEFKKDRIVVSEDSCNEFMFESIETVEILNSKEIKIRMKDKKEDIIMNVNRIARSLREEFKSQLLSLEVGNTETDK